MIYPFAIWSKMLETFEYRIVPEDSTNKRTEFFVEKVSKEQTIKWMIEREKWIEAGPPRESNSFKTGKRFVLMNAKDLDNNYIRQRDLKGKILVINFWFINCPPCLKEIPELNQLATEYSNDSSVVFLALARDWKEQVNEFLLTTPFVYKIIPNDDRVVDKYGVNGWPANVIVSPEGKVYFHTLGYSVRTVVWLRKKIEELKKRS